MQAIIHTPTNKLENSIEFYKKLGFTEFSSKEPTLFADNKVIIEINPDRFARAGLKLFKQSWSDTVKQLEKLTAVTKLDNGFLLSDSNGVWIYLIEEKPKYDLKTDVETPSVLGNNMGLSLETTDFTRSSEIWQTVGFEKKEMQGWVVFESEDGLTISLMEPNNCPHLFYNPSLTFFNSGKNPEVIRKVRDLNILITEEITYFNKEGNVDNIIIRDPGGYGFFVFND